MVVLSVLLPVLKRALPLRRLVPLMWTTGKAERSHEQERRIIALSARITRLRPRLRSNCLERGLLTYRFLARAGADPHLVVGVTTFEGAIVGHAWVTLDGEPVHELREAVDGFARLIEFGPQGEATEARHPGHGDELPRVWR
jgi:transglutaminase superfamily protein